MSGQTTVHVAQRQGKQSGREQLLQQVYAVLRGVPGTQPYMYAKRAMALRMIAQQGPPTFFLTLTAHETQPHLILACAIAHLRSKEEHAGAAISHLEDLAESAVDTLMNKRGKWEGFTATGLCKRYPATVAREFMRMLRSILRWLAPDVDEGADGGAPAAEEEQPEMETARDADTEACRDGRAHKADTAAGSRKGKATKKESRAAQPPHRDPRLFLDEDKMDDDKFEEMLGAMRWESKAAMEANNDWENPTEELPPFIVADYLARIEWQKRGMPHAHILLWSPGVDAMTRKEKQQNGADQNHQHDFGPDDDVSDHDAIPEPTNIPEAYDRFVCTTAPKRWREVYQNFIMADLSDRIRHAHSPYCAFRTTGACRFGYPQPPVPNARLFFRICNVNRILSRSCHHV